MIDINIIYPKRLFVDFYRSIKDYKTVFFIVPILIGMFMAFLIDDSQKDSIDGLINSSLTSFVPIFATILSVYISWVFAKRKTRHDNERIQIFQETTNAIFVLIPLVLFAIGAFFMSHMPCGAYSIRIHILYPIYRNRFDYFHDYQTFLCYHYKRDKIIGRR